MRRRMFFTGTIAGAAGLVASSCANKRPATVRTELFRFVHFTDVHLRPERGAPEGFATAIAAINACEPDFAVGGGDQINDALAVDEVRANLEYDLYLEHRARFDMPVYELIGNHEIFGITAPDVVPRDHPDWGKELFRRRLGNGATWRSFDHKGFHFVLLDTIGIEPEGDAYRYFGEIGPEQFDWLESDLTSLPENTPVIMFGHIPLATCYELLKNGPDAPASRTTALTDGPALYRLIAKHRILALFEGHMHVNELYRYLGSSFIDTGAICGNWWNGVRDGHPEGFNLVHVYEDGVEAEYVTYGWDASQYT